MQRQPPRFRGQWPVNLLEIQSVHSSASENSFPLNLGRQNAVTAVLKSFQLKDLRTLAPRQKIARVRKSMTLIFESYFLCKIEVRVGCE